MRVLHVITSLSRQGGGPSRSSQGLVGGLRAAGVDAWLMTLSHGEEPWIKGCDQFLNGATIEEAIARVTPHLVHLHGIWDLRLHHCAVICRREHVPYVIAPRGMLEPWSLKTKWLKKRIARWVYQDADLRYAAALHATAESEAEQFRKLGFRNPIIVSPNGVNVPDELPPRVRSSDGRKRVLFVSRMHPKKGVLELVEAWAKIKHDGWCCELVYTVGNDFERAYEQKVKDRVKSLGLTDVIFTGKLDDTEKWNAYRRADLFCLPTYSENFGIVIAEALYAGVPVITTKGTPWGEIDESCGWWIDLPPVDSLVSALQAAIQMADTQYDAFVRYGQNGQKLVSERYLWAPVAKLMVNGYSRIFMEG